MTEKHTPSGLLHEPEFVCRNKIFHLQCTRFGTLVPRRHLCWEMSVWTLPEAFCRLVFCVCWFCFVLFLLFVCLFFAKITEKHVWGVRSVRKVNFVYTSFLPLNPAAKAHSFL